MEDNQPMEETAPAEDNTMLVNAIGIAFFGYVYAIATIKNTEDKFAIAKELVDNPNIVRFFFTPECFARYEKYCAKFKADPWKELYLGVFQDIEPNEKLFWRVKYKEPTGMPYVVYYEWNTLSAWRIMENSMFRRDRQELWRLDHYNRMRWGRSQVLFFYKEEENVWSIPSGRQFVMERESIDEFQSMLDKYTANDANVMKQYEALAVAYAEEEKVDSSSSKNQVDNQ